MTTDKSSVSLDESGTPMSCALLGSENRRDASDTGVKPPEQSLNFSLLGGPLHRLGCRLGLVRARTNSLALGFALGGSAWAVLVVLALAEGISAQIFSLSVIGGHVRLLVAIPLFFLCESMLDPRMTAFVHTIVSSKLVPTSELPVLESDIARTARCKDSWLPDAMCLLLAMLTSSIAPVLSLPGTTAAYDANVTGATTLTALWYWTVCLTLVRFLMFRWIFRLGVWWYFLWRISKLKLNLVPIHPDRAAGLGYLEVVHSEFLPLILGISAIVSAGFAESMVAGRTSLTAVLPAMILLLLAATAMLIGPLCIFGPKLWLCRMNGLETYTDFAARYVNDFQEKWLGRPPVSADSLLGTADLQSLADLSTSVRIVDEMRVVPVSRRLLLIVAAAVLLPMLPLLLLAFPIDELAKKLLGLLFGL